MFMEHIDMFTPNIFSKVLTFDNDKLVSSVYTHSISFLKIYLTE